MTDSSRLHDLLKAIVRETTNDGEPSQVEFVMKILDGAKQTPGVDSSGSKSVIQPYINELQIHLDKHQLKDNK